MNFEPNQKQLTFVLPDSFRNAELILTNMAGLPEYLRIPIQADNSVFRVISTASLAHGAWRAQLNWALDNYRYCNERVIEVS